jgi:hemoglobin
MNYSSRDMADRMEIDETVLSALIAAFYAQVRADAELGPVFNEAVGDWDEHQRLLTAFWSSIMLGSGRYKGSPVAEHVKHAGRITAPLFARWLDLWRLTTDDVLPPAAAIAMQVKAGRIAESLQLAIAFQTDAQRARHATFHQGDKE